MEAILWISIGIIFYTFIGYGLVITLLAKFKNLISHPELNDEDLPEITLLIAAYNEDEIINDKINNTLKLDYPSEKIKIVFVTDGSSDNTNQILEKFKGIKVFYKTERRGKIAAINRVMPFIKSPITIFSDANVMINRSGIRELVKHFQNNLVGAVSGEKKIKQNIKDGASATGEGFYWKYESYLKRKDAEWNTLVGSAGELFAIRTFLFESIDETTIIEDFVLTLRIAANGYKVAYEPKAIANEAASANIEEETKRKVRISAGGLQAIIKLKYLLNPFKFGKLSFQLISHRILRWTLTPIALVTILLLSLILSESLWYCQLLFRLQLIFYFLALVGYSIRNESTRLKLLYIPYYFTFMHVCVVKGWIRYLSGKQSITWEKAVRAKFKSSI